MIRRSLELLARASGDGHVALCAPALGLVTNLPRQGEGLVARSIAGQLVVLGHRIDLLVPPAGAGRIVEVRLADASEGVAYGAPLLVVAPESPATPARPRSRSAARKTSAAANPALATPTDPAPLGLGEYPLRATTTGIFYARPDPASPPFVTEGASLEAGQTAGLIEVMKCFSPIVHPGGAIPSPARILRSLVREGDEVRPGQILFVLAE